MFSSEITCDGQADASWNPGHFTSSILQFSANSGLALFGISDRNYQIEYTENVASPNWKVFTTVEGTADGTLISGTRPGSNQKRFYRAMLVP